MFHGYDGSHSVSYVRSGEVRILILKDSKFPCILVYNLCKHSLKACDMGSTLGVIDIVTETEDVLMELVYILKRRLNLYILAFAGKINDIRNGLVVFIKVFNKSPDSVRFVECNGFRCLKAIRSLIRIDYGKIRVKICRFMHSGLNILFPETEFFEYFGIRLKVYLCSGLLCFSHSGKKSVLFKFLYRLSLLKTVVMDKAFPAYFNIKVFGKGVNRGRTNTMKTAACLIDGIVKLSAGMKCRKHHAFRRHSLFMHSHGNSSTVIFHGTASVRFQRNINGIAKTRQMLIHRVVHYLINTVIKSLCTCASDIHTGALSYRLKTFKDCDTALVIIILWCHEKILSYL